MKLRWFYCLFFSVTEIFRILMGECAQNTYKFFEISDYPASSPSWCKITLTLVVFLVWLIIKSLTPSSKKLPYFRHVPEYLDQYSPNKIQYSSYSPKTSPPSNITRNLDSAIKRRWQSFWIPESNGIKLSVDWIQIEFYALYLKIQ